MSSTNNTKTYNKQNSQGGDNKQTQQKSKTNARGGRNTNALATGYKKPSVKPKFNVPIRTTSAPPDLSVQQKKTQLQTDAPPFVPRNFVCYLKDLLTKKQQPFLGYGQPFNAYGNFYYPPTGRGRGSIPHGSKTPLFVPPSQYPSQPSGEITKPARRQSSQLKIVNPKTGEDVITGEKVLDVNQIMENKELKKLQETKPVESKQVETKPIETKQPVETKTVESKQVEIKQNETKPIEEKKPKEPKIIITKPEEKISTTEKEIPKSEQKIEEKKIEETKIEEKKEEPKIEEKKEKTEEIKKEEKKTDELKEQKETVVPSSRSESEYEEEEGESEGEEDEQEIPEITPKKTEGGRIQYTKEQLLQFKHLGVNPPESLRLVDVFMDSSTTNRPPPSPTGPPRLSFGKGRGRGAKRESVSSRGRGFGGKFRGGKLKRGTKKLVKGKNAWKGGDENKDENQKIYDQCRDILNKITDKTYEKLKGQFLEIKIPSPEILKGVIDQIYEQAVRFPSYSHLFADLCKDLSEHQSEHEKDNAFKKLLLNKCQEEFQKAPKVKSEIERIRAEVTDEEEALELVTNLKKRMVGNIVFIGELFLRKMLSEKIMHEIVKELLLKKEIPDEDEIEVLCNLLKKIGKILDHEKAKKFFDFYFNKLTILSKETKVPSRLRFMLMDIIELRANNWTIKKQEPPQPKPKPEYDKRDDFRKREFGRVIDTRGGRISRTAKEKMKRQTEKTEVEDGWSTAKPKLQKRAPSASQIQGQWKKEQEEIQAQNTFSALSVDEETQSPTSPKEEPEKNEENTTFEDIEQETQSIIKIYLDDQEEQDAIDSIMKINPKNHPIVVKTMIESSIEKSKEDRNNIASLIITMKKEIQSWSKSVEIGFEKAVDKMVEDQIWVDVPVAFEIIGSIIGKCILNEVTTFNFADKIISKYSTKLKHRYLIQFARSILEVQKSEYEENDNLDEFNQKLTNSPFNVLHYINPVASQEINDLINDFDSKEILDCDIVVKVLNSIKEDEDIETIIDWVKGLEGEKSIITRKVSCAILSGILLLARDEEQDVKELIEKYSPVFKELIKSKKNLQVAILSEAQYIAYRAKYEKGILTQLFKNLYEVGIIEKDSFITWKSESKDAPGKKEAIKEVESFINKL